MVKRKSKSKSESPAPPSESYRYVSRLLDSITALAAYDPEKDFEQRVKEGERQLEIVAGQIMAQHEKELARRAECRRLRLEREAAEKAAAEAESRSKSPRQPRNRVRKAG